MFKLLFCVFFSQAMANVYFVNNFANSDYTAPMPNASNLVFIGETEECHQFKFQALMLEKANIVKKSSDIGRVCTYNDVEFPDISNYSIDFNEIYAPFTVNPYGDEIPLYSDKYFDISLLIMNGNFGYSLINLMAKLNLEASNKNKLFIVTINNLEFNNLYDKTIFEKIVESNQVLMFIVSESPSSSPKNVYTLANWPNENELSITASGMDIKISLFKYNTTTLETTTKSFVYNFIENKECNYQKCFVNCDGVTSDDEICIGLPEFTEYMFFSNKSRHLVFNEFDRDCSSRTRRSSIEYVTLQEADLFDQNDENGVKCTTIECMQAAGKRIYDSIPYFSKDYVFPEEDSWELFTEDDDADYLENKRRKRSTDVEEDEYKLPKWFLNYLIKRDLAIPDMSLHLTEKILFKMQVFSPSFSTIARNNTFYSDYCTPNVHPVPRNNFPDNKFKVYYRNGTVLPLYNLAKCYHLVTRGNDECLVYNVEETLVNMETRITNENEKRERVSSAGKTFFSFKQNEEPITEKTTTTTTTTTEPSNAE